jgi:DNA primase
MIAEWRIGLAPDGWRNMHAYLSKFTPEEVLDKAGLIKYSEDRKSVYDRFRNRVMFPLFDSSGRVIAFSGRLLGKEEAGSPKYLNSPDSLLFNKSETLYGFHKAKDGIRKWKYAVLVEGQMDLLMCHAHGFDNAIATSGTSLTDLHAKMIKRLTDKLMVIYDADKAGINATLRAWSIALKNNLDVKVAVLPKDEDPASVILKDKKIFVEALKGAVHVIDYYLNVVVEGHKGESDKRALRKEVVAKVLPLVKAIESAVDRSHFISKIALATQIAEKDLEEDLSKAPEILEKDFENNFIRSDTSALNSGPKSQLDRIIERIAGLTTIIYKGNVEEAKQSLDTLFKHQPTADLNIDELHSSIAQVQEGIFNRIVKIVELPPPDVLFEAEILYAGSPRMNEELTLLVTDLEEITLKELFTKVMTELQRVEREGDKEKAKELLMVCKEITLHLSKISQGKFKEKEAKEGK